MERHEADVLLARVERLERRMRVVVAGWVVSVAILAFLGVAVRPGHLPARGPAGAAL